MGDFIPPVQCSFHRARCSPKYLISTAANIDTVEFGFSGRHSFRHLSFTSFYLPFLITPKTMAKDKPPKMRRPRNGPRIRMVSSSVSA